MSQAAKNTQLTVKHKEHEENGLGGDRPELRTESVSDDGAESLIEVGGSKQRGSEGSRHLRMRCFEHDVKVLVVVSLCDHLLHHLMQTRRSDLDALNLGRLALNRMAPRI